MISEYRRFLETEYYNRRFSLYEKVCNFFGSVKIPLTPRSEAKFKDDINFCHLRVTPSTVLSTAMFLPVVIFFILSGIFFVLGIFSPVMVLMLAVLSLVLFYYLYSYTRFLTKYFRAKAAAEMSLAIIYMSISLKVNANLESAVAFAATNLSGPLGLDLRKILWDMETGGLVSVIDGLDWLSEKWKSENDEFVDAISLLKISVYQSAEVMDNNVKEAVRIMIDGTKARMKKFALRMRSPLKILNAFGILLPMLGLIFFPILIIFVPEISRPEMIGFSYMILFPSIVYLFLRQYFYAKPYSYHQVEMRRLGEFKRQRNIALILAIFIAVTSSSYLIYKLLGVEEFFSAEQFIYSFLIIVCLSISVMFYSFLSSFNYLGRNEDILKIESEMSVALFQLSIVSGMGKPIERCMEDLLPRIKTLKISEAFQKILYNITTFGMTLNSAVFEENVGVIYSYPSKIITIAFRLIVDMSKKGMEYLSIALRSVSEFMKDADEVNNATEEILSETTSDMQVQALIFAPLSAGIVVGLMAIVIYIFAFFGQSMVNVKDYLDKSGFGMSNSIIEMWTNMGKQIPFHYFQIIVGVFMIEIIYIISYFLGELNFGEDEVSKLYSLGKTMLVGIIIYSIVACTIYFGMSSLINLKELTFT